MGPRTVGVALLLALLSTTLRAQGVRTWYGNEVFMHELESSIKLFFGNRVGTYVRSDNFAFTLAPMDATNRGERMLIATQFLAVFGRGAPGMRPLDDNRVLYDYSAFQQGTMRVAIVTPNKDATILAAAITHWSCGSIAATDVHDAAIVRSNYESARCKQPSVTIFFENRGSVSPAIRKELAKWGTRPLVALCESGRRMGLLDYPASSPQRERYAKHLQQLPPCRVHYNVVILNP